MSSKIKKALAFLEKNGYTKVPQINTSEIKKQFYITYENSHNGIALVELTDKDRKIFRITYFNKEGREINISSNTIFRPYVTPDAPQFGTFSIPAGKLTYISHMWYKPMSFFSLKPITLVQLEPTESPAPVAPVMRPVVQTSNRMGGRKRRRTRRHRFRKLIE